MIHARRTFCLVAATVCLLFWLLTPRHSDRRSKRNAYVVLNTNRKSLFQSLVLFHQLKSQRCIAGQYVIMVPSDLHEAFQLVFTALGIESHVFEEAPLFEIRYNVTQESTLRRDRMMWQKLRAWGLIQFDKVVLLDNDLLVRRNIDRLFALPELSGVPAVYEDEKIVFWDPSLLDNYHKASRVVPGRDGLNAGVLVLEPKASTLKALIDEASSLDQRTCCPMQEFLFRFFERRHSFNRISSSLNQRKIHRQPAINIDAIDVYHFVERQKPMMLGKRRCQDTLCLQWWTQADSLVRRMDRLCRARPLLCTLFSDLKREAIHFEREDQTILV